MTDTKLRDEVQLIVDQPEAGILRLTLEREGEVLSTLDQSIAHNADDILLQGVDRLLRERTMNKSALLVVRIGAGIDKNSSLYRIVGSFASAVSAARRSEVWPHNR